MPLMNQFIGGILIDLCTLKLYSISEGDHDGAVLFGGTFTIHDIGETEVITEVETEVFVFVGHTEGEGEVDLSCLEVWIVDDELWLETAFD